MTALAMVIGMIPMALGLGDGGEQNAPLGRAVIGGLLVATAVTLFVVPVVYSLLRRKPPTKGDLDARFEAETRGHDGTSSPYQAGGAGMTTTGLACPPTAPPRLRRTAVSRLDPLPGGRRLLLVFGLTIVALAGLFALPASSARRAWGRGGRRPPRAQHEARRR